MIWDSDGRFPGFDTFQISWDLRKLYKIASLLFVCSPFIFNKTKIKSNK